MIFICGSTVNYRLTKNLKFQTNESKKIFCRTFDQLNFFLFYTSIQKLTQMICTGYGTA